MHLLKCKESFYRQRRGGVTLNMEAGESKSLNPFRGTILGTFRIIHCFHRMMEKKNYNNLRQAMVIQTLLTVRKERKDRFNSELNQRVPVPIRHPKGTSCKHTLNDVQTFTKKRLNNHSTHMHACGRKKPPDFRKEHQDWLK